MLFWKEALTSELFYLYDKIYRECAENISIISCGNFQTDSIIKCYTAVCNDHPELYYLTSYPKVSCCGSIWKQDHILNLAPLYNQQQREAIDHNCRYALSLIKQKANGMLDIVSIEKAVIEYIVTNTDYAIDNLKNQNMASVLCFRKAQCSGFAKAFKYVMDQYGFECIVVEGSASENPSNNLGPQNNHAWNIIRIGNDYYHVDVTMIVGANQNKSLPLNYIDFNCSDEYIQHTHVWDYTKYPKCNSTKYNSLNISTVQHTMANQILINEIPAYISRFIIKKDITITFIVDSSDQPLEKLHNEVMSKINSSIASFGIGLSYQVKATNNLFEISVDYR